MPMLLLLMTMHPRYHAHQAPAPMVLLLLLLVMILPVVLDLVADDVGRHSAGDGSQHHLELAAVADLVAEERTARTAHHGRH